MVREMCQLTHIANPRYSPKLAVKEYEIWWNNTRPKRSEQIQQEGNLILKNAKQLFNKLQLLKSKSEIAVRLFKELSNHNANFWPHELHQWKAHNLLEVDVLNDWFFMSERKIKANLPQEYSTVKYRY